MPSWNVHTAHVERLLADNPADKLGIEDVNAFLFGNFVPDIYVGFMVPDTTIRIDYRITHVATYHMIPVPDADRFWNDYLVLHRPKSPAGLSVTLGAWAHLVTDQVYNVRFRAFWETHDTPGGEELRKSKQGDFDLFGRTLGISSHIQQTSELIDAAQAFWPYSILAADVKRTVDVADAIVRKGSVDSSAPVEYRLLNDTWMRETFVACNERLAQWLGTWQELENRGLPSAAADIRTACGFPPENL